METDEVHTQTTGPDSHRLPSQTDVRVNWVTIDTGPKGEKVDTSSPREHTDISPRATRRPRDRHRALPDPTHTDVEHGDEDTSEPGFRVEAEYPREPESGPHSPTVLGRTLPVKTCVTVVRMSWDTCSPRQQLQRTKRHRDVRALERNTRGSTERSLRTPYKREVTMDIRYPTLLGRERVTYE